MLMATYTATAPGRIDFAGGWTDAPPYSTDVGGAVLNAAVGLHTRVTLTTRRPRKGRPNVVLRSLDFDAVVEADSVEDLRYDGNLDFIKAVLKVLGAPAALDLTVQCDYPPKAGLGGSGSLGVCLVGLLDKVTGGRLRGDQIPEKAHDIEVHELGVLGGKQDQYAAMFGGVNFLEFKDPAVKREPLRLRSTILGELTARSVLVYTGHSRVSGDIHAKVFGAYRRHEPETCRALDRIREIPYEMRNALVAGAFDRFGALLNENWDCQKRLHPSVTNETVDEVFRLAVNRGALGGKACGAGGGGCLYFLTARPNQSLFSDQETGGSGPTVLKARLARRGLRITARPGA